MKSRVYFIILIGSIKEILNQPLCEWNTCQECIVDPKNCVWCSSENFDSERRCQPASLVNETVWCPSGFQNPLSKFNVTEDNEFRSISGDSIQLKPQKYQLDLRVGETVSLNFSYKAAENFPVDVYFVLDTSQSTKYFKDNLLHQSRNIFNTLRSLTSDVFMGLGTFGDKNLIPFAISIDANKTNSFKNQLSLTNNIDKFTKVLNGTTFGQNYDPPEGGFDAIAQAIACKEQIQWREQSRKILVHITDQIYHSAGDGKFSGRMKPYDGECHLNEEGFYSMEKVMDYPSVSIINKMATKEQITLFFVSSYEDESVYSKLQSVINGSVYEKYEEEAINHNLEEIYKSITHKLVLAVNFTSEDLEVSFKPDCVQFEGCTMEKGEEKHITAKITVKKFFGAKKINLGINPKGLKEKLSLDVNVVADCACDRTVVNRAASCNFAGNLRCGVCECFKDKYGPTCSCSENSSECKPVGMDKECSGHGNCFCGKCECFTGYNGKQCQYRNNNCKRGLNNLLCSDQGICRDGVCLCGSGWLGDGCECPDSKASCMVDKQECANKGWCDCGKCKCYDLPKWDVRSFKDEYCQQNPCNNDCHKRQCRKIIPCIECLHNGEWKDCEETCGGKMIVVKQSEADIPEDMKKNWNMCSQVRVDFGCYANYSYIYNDNRTMTLFVLNERNCKESQIVYGVIALVVLVLVGVATLVAWKLLTDARDRREYELFLKAAEAMDCEEQNAAYVPPTTTYINPAFQKYPHERSN